jgi:hypothetical protein
VLAPSLLAAKTQTHAPFQLLTEDGKIINPLTGENAINFVRLIPLPT